MVGIEEVIWGVVMRIFVEAGLDALVWVSLASRS